MSCTIILEKPSENFFPGERVKGKVVCDFENHEDVKGVMVKLVGREQTAYPRLRMYRSGNSRIYSTVDFSGENNFLQEETNVVKGSANPGSFEYPFEFVLPKKCPGSFVSENGKIQYYIETTVEVPSAVDYKTVEEFNVASFIDFNAMPDLNMKPIKYQDEKVLSYCCYSSGPYTMDLNLEKEGFVLGEAMKLRIHITNMTSTNIPGLHIELKLRTKEKTTRPNNDSKAFDKLIAAINDTGVEAHSERDYDLLLKIAAETVLPNFTSCTLFETWTTLRVEAKLPGCYKNLSIETRVTLGHIPQDTGTEKGLTVIGGAKDPIDPQHKHSNEKELLGIYPQIPPLISEPEKPEINNVLLYQPSGSSDYPPGAPSTFYPPSVPAPPKIPIAKEDDCEIVGGD